MELEVMEVKKTDEKIQNRIEQFIMSERTNGEFINSLKYLSYHPSERFQTDSIAVIDRGSREVRGVLLAVKNPTDATHVISHMGTTFSGPILDYRFGIRENMEILQRIFEYYEARYRKVEIRLRPTTYDSQPMEFISYYLQNAGYQSGMMALANIINISNIVDQNSQMGLYDSKRRNHVKKAIKNDRLLFRKEEHISLAIWECMNDNLRKKYNSSTTHTYEEIKALSALCPNNIQAYSVYKKTGEYAAFALIYKFKTVFHTQYLDLNYEFSSEYPHLFLIHHLIQEAKKDGYSYFSFGASTESKGKVLNEGLYQYKDGYGGGSILLPVYTKICKG